MHAVVPHVVLGRHEAYYAAPAWLDEYVGGQRAALEKAVGALPGVRAVAHLAMGPAAIRTAPPRPAHPPAASPDPARPPSVVACTPMPVPGTVSTGRLSGIRTDPRRRPAGRGRRRMTKVLAVVGAKGGTLKTSSVVALGHLAARAGLRVVMVDADPQGDLTRRSGYARVADPAAAPGVEVPGAAAGGGLRLLRGGRSLEGADVAGAARHLARAAGPGTDLVLVDTPPALGPLTTAAVRAAGLVLVPAVPGRESLEHVHDVLALARRCGATTVRVVLTLVHRRSTLARWMREQTDALYPGLRLDPILPIEMAAGEAAVYERPVTAHAPRSHSAAAYRALAAALLPALGLPAGAGEGA